VSYLLTEALVIYCSIGLLYNDDNNQQILLSMYGFRGENARDLLIALFIDIYITYTCFVY